MWNKLVFTAMLCLPVVTHIAMVLQYPPLANGYLILSLLLLVVNSLKQRAIAISVLWAVLCITALVMLLRQQSQYFLYLLPVVINVFLFTLFALTLRKNTMPLITRYDLFMDGSLDPQKQHYTRKVTWAWTLFLLLMSVESATLAIFTPIEIWSLFTNFINYLLVLGMFVGEYILRQYFFPDAERHFIGLMRKLMRIKPAELMFRG